MSKSRVTSLAFYGIIISTQGGMKKRRIKNLVLCVALLAVGLVGGYVIANFVVQKNSTALQEKYSLLSRRILIENPNDVILDFRKLNQDLQQYIDANIGQDKVSLYFEHLPTGSSIGINEDKEIIGASLLKLPVVITAYKYAEEGKLNLDELVPLKKEWLNDSYGDLYKKGEGYKISIREATQYALEKSDNTALLLLFDKIANIQGGPSANTLDFVDANFNTDPNQRVLIGAQSYSSVLKCLYFSCHLNKDNSQEILRYLTMSTASDRLTKHISNDIKVAHKIGTYGKNAQSDCGIVYLDKRNYLLCVMMIGEDGWASEHIATLSRIVYDAVSSQRK